MTKVRLRHVLRVNPPSPVFDQLAGDTELTFLPMEAVWPGDRLDLSRVRVKRAVATGYTRFQDGDVLVPKITPTFEASRSVLIGKLINKAGVGTTELHVLRAGPLIDRRYLLHVTRSYPFLKLGESEMYGVAGQKRVPDDFVRDYVVDLPSLEEQRCIAEFLNAEGRRIEELDRQTQKQVELIQLRSIEFYRRLTTIGTSNDARPSGIPWMPLVSVDSTLHKVGRAFRTGSGTTPNSQNFAYFDGEYPWVNTGDLRDNVVYKINRTVTVKALQDYSSLKVYHPGALIVAMYGATIGRVGILGRSACVNQACCVLYNSHDLELEYAFYWFLAHRSEIIRLASGGGQPNISQDVIRRLRIPAPDARGQRLVLAAIREYEEHTRTQMALLNQRRKLLSERRQALITAAVTGQIEVATARGAEL